MSELPDRLASRIDFGPSCWLWRGWLSEQGYGRVWFNGRNQPAHRPVYELLVGPIPTGLTLDHTCHNADLSCPGGPSCRHRRCVNPAHLEPATLRENTLRSSTSVASVCARKTVCPHGHSFYRLRKNGKRECRECHRIRNRIRRNRERLEARLARQAEREAA